MGQALGGFGATVAVTYSWQTAFHTFGLIGIVYAAILVFFLREKKDSEIETTSDKILIPEKVPIFKGLALLFSNISFWIILMYFAIPSLPGWGVKNWLPTLFAQNLNMPMEQAGPLSTLSLIHI